MQTLLGMLAPRTPVSRNIFERGFYCEGTKIKYRASVVEALLISDVYLLHSVMILISGGLLYSSLQNARWLNAFLALWLLFTMLLLKASLALTYSIRPSLELDLADRMVRHKNSETAFSILTSIRVLKHKNKFGDRVPQNEVNIILHCPFEDIPFTKFHKRNEALAESICESLKRIISKDLQVIYETS